MESKSLPKLNIVIPCWNASRYLPELLDSILAQTFNDWQLIVVDDQSTDNTISILEQYKEKDTRITYIIRDRQPKGAQTCRNIGFKAIRNAKYVIFMDADDILAPYCFEQRVRYMERHADLDYAVFPAKVFEKEVWDDNKFIIGFDDNQNEILTFLFRILPFSIWNNIYSVNSLRENKVYWDEQLLSLQDTDFALQTLFQCMRHQYAEQSRIDYFWRVVRGSNSITTKIKTKKHAKSHIRLYDKLYEINCAKNDYNIKYGIHYGLLLLLENIKGDSELISQYFLLPWIKESFWFKIRLFVYGILPNNNKIKHALFPRLISKYLEINRLHQISLNSFQRNVIGYGE